MTPDEKIRNDEQYYYNSTPTNRTVRERTYFNWVPLLLIPLFFVLGWVTKGAYDTPNNNSVNNPQYGVGGGPGTVVTPYPAGYVASPTAVPKAKTEPVTPEVTPSNVDSEVQDTATPSPSSTGKATAKPTVTPED